MQKRAYQKELDGILSALDQSGTRPHLLLHSCCGPCTSYVLQYLVPHYRVTVLYDNPNIHPEAEYHRRLNALKDVIAHIPSPEPIRLLEGEYDPERYFQAVRGLESGGEGSARCEACFFMRLQSAATTAKALGCDVFASTLSISPMKNAETLNSIGEQVAAAAGLTHLPNDFKKRGGYQASLTFCRAWDIYRQDYCGCIFSQREAAQQRAERALDNGKG